jgi:hypothetical protein
MDERIGDRIKAWRGRRGGMSQQVLADLSGLSQTYLRHRDRQEPA